MVCYSDDYQSYLPRKAGALDRNSADYAALMHRAIKLSCELAEVSFDHFPGTKDNIWFRNSVEHYLNCVEEDLSEEQMCIPRCPKCQKWGHEAWGRGACNMCGASSDASQCENCAAKPDPQKMTEMCCINCGEAMEMAHQDAMVWALGRHFEAIAQKHATRGMRENLRTYLASWLNDTKDRWQITRPGDAGLPMERYSGDPVHTWFMGLSGYRAAIQEFLNQNPQRGSFEDWWSPHTEVVHFLGFDCSYSHAIGYAVQQHCDPNGPQVGRFLTNHFLKLDGDDFSTSRGNAVWIKDLTGLYPIDSIRLFTLLHAPEAKSENFSLTEYKRWHHESFLPLRNIMMSESEATDPKGSTWEDHPIIVAYRQAAQLDSFSPRLMAEMVMEFASEVYASLPTQRESGYRALRELAKPLMPTLGSMVSKDNVNESA
tara:strand:- start:5281 stop:6567 length:1287 start_codon:yes stop_codon:yes gene_type:complete